MAEIYEKKGAMKPWDCISAEEIVSQDILEQIRKQVKADGFRCDPDYGSWRHFLKNRESVKYLALDEAGDLVWLCYINLEDFNLIKLSEVIGLNENGIKQVYQTSDGAVFDTLEEAQRNNVRIKLYTCIRSWAFLKEDHAVDVEPLVDELMNKFDISAK